MSPRCDPECPGMKRAVLCFLLLTGFCSCLHEYHLVDEKKTWFEAQTYCRHAYTDLATVDSLQDMKGLMASVGSAYEGQVWIGLYDIDWAWDWSLGDLRYYKLGEYIYKKWQIGEPNNMRAPQLCTAMLGSYWFDFYCNETFTFVCYSNPAKDPTLPADSTTNYIYISQAMSWNGAQSYCRTTYTDLASIRHLTENGLITQVIPSAQYVHIGLYRVPWMWWSDKAASTFRYWANGPPLVNSGDCAASVINATHVGKWVENPCDVKLDFVCHNKKKQVFILRLMAVNPSVDLNNPDVLVSIKTFMEDKMKGMGFIRDIRMSWIKLAGKNIFHIDEKEMML